MTRSDRSFALAQGGLPGKASPAEVAQYGQDNDDDDDDPKQGHVDLLFIGDGMTLRLVTRVAFGQNPKSALRAESIRTAD